jgi:nicotinamide mononucleotide (NMN) deamidase PncC
MRENLGASWGLAELGATGPAGTRYGHPPGICVLAVDGPVSLTRRVETGSGDREANMWTFVEAGFGLLREALERA